MFFGIGANRSIFLFLYLDLFTRYRVGRISIKLKKTNRIPGTGYSARHPIFYLRTGYRYIIFLKCSSN